MEAKSTTTSYAQTTKMVDVGTQTDLTSHEETKSNILTANTLTFPLSLNVDGEIELNQTLIDQVKGSPVLMDPNTLPMRMTKNDATVVTTVVSSPMATAQEPVTAMLVTDLPVANVLDTTPLMTTQNGNPYQVELPDTPKSPTAVNITMVNDTTESEDEDETDNITERIRANESENKSKKGCIIA